jgi:cytochrome c oxidase subunit 2
MLVAIAFILLVVISVAFHLWSPWWFTPLASDWGTIDLTVDITFWVTGAVFIAVNLFMAYAIIRYRNKGPDTARARYEPENPKLEIWLTVVTAIGVAAILAPGLVVWNDFVNVPDEAWEVEVVGEQWRWTYRLPGEDDQLGTSDASLVNIKNPLGVNPNDPNGQDDLIITSNIVHIPIDKPVKMLLRSKDVLHDFAVAEFRVKMDLVPGLVTYIWLTPTKIGTYDVLCEELCGLAHFTMRGKVVVDTQEDFDAWKAEQMTFAETQAISEGNVAVGQALYGICAACHGQNGEGNVALNSPKLSGQADWYIAQQLHNFKHGIRGAHEDDEFGKQMAPMAAVLADDAAIRNVSAYVASLPPHITESSAQGDIERGMDLYLTCGTCHGMAGQGNYATHSPKLSGQEDWYLTRQLQNFRNGVRGEHPDDLFGPQMRSMARMLRTDDDVNDIVAYIGTLSQTDQLAQATNERSQ